MERRGRREDRTLSSRLVVMEGLMRWISLVLVVGCGGSTVSFPDASSDDSGTGVDATVDSSMTDSGVDTGLADTMPCPLKCSPDTFNVLDCNDNVVTMCQPTEAC